MLNVLPNVIRLQEKYLNVQTETVSTIYIIEKKDKAFDILQAVTINNKFDHTSLDIWDTDIVLVYCYIHHAFRPSSITIQNVDRDSAPLGNHNFKLFSFFYRCGNPQC